MVALLVYLGYMHDFLVTAALAFLWLVCSSAWAKGLQNIKYSTGDKGLAGTLDVCADAVDDVTCSVTEYAD
ncbi:hypothetical protein CRUP_028247, partial [Coryphaenoides rupestris]